MVAGFFYAQRGGMSQYEYLQSQKELCEQLARIYAGDFMLHKFYKNAAKGYEIKKQRLTVEDAARE